jgi:uncharacterized protein (TIGR03435 family)
MNEHAVLTFVDARRICIFAIGCIALAFPLFGQRPAPISIEMGNKEMTYDINTITLSKVRCKDDVTRINTLPDGISATNISLKSLIQSAYGAIVQSSISTIPKWVISTRFDIELKMAPSVAEAFRNLPADLQISQRQYMLQLILLDRFNLIVHNITKNGIVYEMTVVDRLKLKDTDPETSQVSTIKALCESTGRSVPLGCIALNSMLTGIPDSGGMIVRPGHLTGRGILISALASELADQIGSIVVNSTGLMGKYDIALIWGAMESSTTQPLPSLLSPPAPERTISAALEEQLGLTLKPTKGTVDTIVVDHVQMPVANWPWPGDNATPDNTMR